MFIQLPVAMLQFFLTPSLLDQDFGLCHVLQETFTDIPHLGYVPSLCPQSSLSQSANHLCAHRL